jgi:uncharacterized protein YbjT (DUF2867 family)
MWAQRNGGQQMSDTILVVGATGRQGGGVARHLLKRGVFNVRCVKRRTDSEPARILEQQGAQIVQADLEDPASLRRAVSGCKGVFGVTNFWEAYFREYDQGVNLIDAVAEAEVAHLVLSTLPSAKSMSNGAIKLPHFETKARMEEHAQLRNVPFTFVHVAFYYENFVIYFPPRRQPDGSYSFGFPLSDACLGAVAAEDIGGVVARIFENRADFVDKTVEIIGDEMPAQEYAQIMSRVLKRKITYNHIPRGTYASMGFPGARELADMFEFLRAYTLSRRAHITRCRQLFADMHTFEPWLEKNVHKFAGLFEA